MINRTIQLLIEATFSLAVIGFHVVWFVYYLHHQTQGEASLVTNLLSWEAIFISLFIGYSQKKAHRNLLSIVRPKPKTNTEESLVLPPAEIELTDEEY